ncbi:hypothetical protein EGW08_001987, partial [Elysia chlorotica]
MLENFHRSVTEAGIAFEAEDGDLSGSALSLLRLQRVYGLKAFDMAQGDYLGHKGPALSPVDAYEIGQVAFMVSRLNDSLEWLNASLRLMSNLPAQSGIKLSSTTVKALMGRVHLYGGSYDIAQRLYDEVKVTDPHGGDTVELGKELVERPTPKLQEYQDYRNLSRLCSLENRIHVPNPSHPSMVCRYRPGLLPYYRFKEEIISERPFASVIYNFTSDAEAETFKDRVKNRTVNYGLGGHYSVHLDAFEDKRTIEDRRKGPGNRIATLLLYLSDVTRGGSTVFTKADIAVPPIKNMALFWYNYRPDHHLDYLTYHAGCPVVIGHKWIANKWVWTAGNTFRRRCALSPHASQLDIEADMRNSYLPL